MLKKQPKPPAFGVCLMLAAYADKVIPSKSQGIETRLFIQDAQHNVLFLWNESTAVPSTKSDLFPVAHPTLAPCVAFLTASADKAVWDLSAEYGQNRQQYLEFMSDYLEEAWK